MHKQMLAILAGVWCWTTVCLAATASVGLPGQSADWKQSVATAVNQSGKVTAMMLAIPDGQRADFAREVLGVLLAKRKYMPDKDVWAQDFCATAVALLSGAEQAKQGVFVAVVGVVTQAVKPGTEEWSAADIEQVQALTRRLIVLMEPSDREPLLKSLSIAVGQRSMNAKVAKLLEIAMQELRSLGGILTPLPVKYQNQ